MTLSQTCSAESEIEGWVRGMQAEKNTMEKEREGEMDDTERKLVILGDSGSVDAALVDSAVSY